MSIALSVASIYIFILLGYFAKLKLKDDIQEKSLAVISIYFLLPMLSFWGLSIKKIDATSLEVPLTYAIIASLGIIISHFIGKFFFKDAKDISIVTISSIIGNTGGMGIPLGIAIFGPDSVVYTSLINIVNVFLMYSVGVYFYSRGTFSVKESIKNIFKLPVIWFAVLALTFNFFDIKIHPTIFKSLEMGAYAAMVIQLMIFGMFLYSIKLKTINLKLLLHVGLIKFFVLPLIAIVVLYTLGLDEYFIGIIILALIVPLAVANVNISALYDCKPVDVTVLVFFSSLIFIPYIITIMYFLGKL